jgi:AraC-like DNA-binding protein
MTNAYPEMEKTPPKGGNGPEERPAARDGPVVDLVIRSNALDEMEDLTSSLISPNRLRPLTKEVAFNGVFQVHGLQDFFTFATGYGCSVGVNIQHEPDDERMGFVWAPKGNGQLIMDGRTHAFSSQRGIVMTSGPPRTLNYLDDCATSVLVMNRRKMAEHCAKLLGHDLDRDPQFDPGFDLNSANGQSWLKLFEYATSELASPRSLSRTVPAARQQLEQMAMTGFLLSQSHTYSDALLRPQAAAVPFYVRRAEAYIEAHFAEPLSLAEIAAQAGVSARSLQNGFQTFRNTTPMGFLRSLRLQRVHRVLLAADPGTARVTEIALACGFNHMGEFASAYRRTFGETPRETLVRARAT